MTARPSRQLPIPRLLSGQFGPAEGVGVHHWTMAGQQPGISADASPSADAAHSSSSSSLWSILSLLLWTAEYRFWQCFSCSTAGIRWDHACRLVEQPACQAEPLGDITNQQVCLAFSTTSQCMLAKQAMCRALLQLCAPPHNFMISSSYCARFAHPGKKDLLYGLPITSPRPNISRKTSKICTPTLLKVSF